ncbi:MAG: hypothetical protein D5R98_00100 [Desulfonatronovibrio sp. MSAO_Bac4]|nr:MAG: hypothetical protein D5R98_00100 [Desulfonatronovibrio sp. MSAO_Bac4]
MKKKSFHSELRNNSDELSDKPFQTISSSLLLQTADIFRLSPHQAQIQALKANILPERYLRNTPSLSMNKQILLAESRVFLIGLGGLGGYILEILARTGVGEFILADGDHFEESNLNRQILGTTESIGQSKAFEAEKRIKSVNPFCNARIIPEFLDHSALPALIQSTDLVIDALGGIKFRPTLLDQASKADLPLITGFVAGTTGLASTVYPQGKSPSAFWQGDDLQGAENILGNMATIVSMIATIQASEAIRIITQGTPRLRDKVLVADSENLTFELLEL